MDVPALDKKPNLNKPFVVRNGMLVSLGKPAGHLLTEKEFSNYRLEVEYRFASKNLATAVFLFMHPSYATSMGCIPNQLRYR